MAAQFAAGGSVIPFITLLFRDRGLDLNQTSLIFTASSATLLLFPFLWGMLADRFVSLDRLFVLLNILAGLALAFLATQRQWAGLLLAYTGFFACFNPTLYLLNALSFHHLANPRNQFGALRAWGSLGWTLPFLPISVWLARNPGSDLNAVLYLGAACCAVMAMVSFWLPYTPPGARSAASSSKRGLPPNHEQPSRHGSSAQGTSGPRPQSYGAALQSLLRNPNYLVLLGSMFLMAGSFSLLTYYSPPVLQDAGVPRHWLGPVHAIGVLFEIVLFRWLPGMLRDWRYPAVILIGAIALVLRQLLFALVDNPWILAAGYLLAGAVIVFYNQGVSILVNAMATKEVRSTAQTLLLFFGQGMGPLVANFACGRLAAHTGHSLRSTFLFAAGLAAMAALVVALRGSKLDHAAET